MRRRKGWSFRSGVNRAASLRWLRIPVVLLISALIGLGCARTVKGPVGQGEKGVGLSVPVLDLLKKDTYTPESISPDNIDSDQLKPIGGQKDRPPEQEPFSRYEESSI